MIKGGGDRGKTEYGVCVIIYKGKVEKTECKNYRGISLLSVV